MPQRGEILVERLTGQRVIVIRVVSPEELTCRFADGRLEDRYVFELERPTISIGSFVSSLLSSTGRQPPGPVVPPSERVRTLPLRQPGN